MKRGALPARTAHPFKSLRQYLVGNLPTPPGPFGYGKDLSYPMAGNDQYGDCTIAALVHAAQVQASLVGAPYTVPTDTQIVNEYFSLTGGQDSGLELSTVVKAWTAGTLNSQLAGAATIDVRDEQLMAQALYNFGCLYAVQDDTVPASDAGAPLLHSAA